MDALIIALDQKNKDELKKDISKIFGDINIECYVDPMLSVKRMIKKPVEICFIDARVKRLAGLIELIKQFNVAEYIVLIESKEKIGTISSLISADFYIERPIVLSDLKRIKEALAN